MTDPNDKTARAAEIDSAIKKADAEKVENENKLDKMLAGIDALTKACDSLTKRMDAMEAGEMPGETMETAADAKKRADSIAAGDLDDIDPSKLAPGERKNYEAARNRAIADAQFRADKVANVFGERAPHAMSGEGVLAYRRRLLRAYQPYSDGFDKIDIEALDKGTFAAVETRIYADAVKADQTKVRPGEIRMMSKTLPGGHTVNEWFGSTSAWMQPMAGPVRQYVTEFRSPKFDG